MKLLCVLARDFLIARLPDHDRGVIAAVDEHVAKTGGAKFPGGAARVGFAIEARLLHHQAELIVRIKLRRPGHAMAPAHPVAPACFIRSSVNQCIQLG